MVVKRPRAMTLQQVGELLPIWSVLVTISHLDPWSRLLLMWLSTQVVEWDKNMFQEWAILAMQTTSWGSTRSINQLILTLVLLSIARKWGGNLA